MRRAPWIVCWCWQGLGGAMQSVSKLLDCHQEQELAMIHSQGFPHTACLEQQCCGQWLQMMLCARHVAAAGVCLFMSSTHVKMSCLACRGCACFGAA
jgi:hypothetical protein